MSVMTKVTTPAGSGEADATRSPDGELAPVPLLGRSPSIPSGVRAKDALLIGVVGAPGPSPPPRITGVHGSSWARALPLGQARAGVGAQVSLGVKGSAAASTDRRGSAARAGLSPSDARPRRELRSRPGRLVFGPHHFVELHRRRQAKSPVRPDYAPGTNPAGGVSVFGRDFTTLFRFAVIRTRPNRSTSWACARSAAGIHASHVSSGRSRFGRGRSFSRRCTGGAASNHTCVITTSRADDRFVTFTK